MATEFQTLVWQALEKIPRGQVTTYGDIARYIGRPNAVRAVGSACGANPQLVTVPCHRVVTADGSIGQYADGTKKKKDLLQSEGVTIKKGKVVNFENKRFNFSYN